MGATANLCDCRGTKVLWGLLWLGTKSLSKLLQPMVPTSPSGQSKILQKPYLSIVRLKQVPPDHADAAIATHQVHMQPNPYFDGTTWPRISPLLFTSVWTLTFHFPASRPASCAIVSVAVPVISAALTGMGNTIAAFLPASAGP